MASNHSLTEAGGTESKLAFRVFTEEKGAAELAEWLSDRGIPAMIAFSQRANNPYIGNSILSQEYIVEVAADHFERANELLVDFYNTQLGNVPTDYYLYSFANDELLDILKQADKWGELDFSLARYILHQRGVEISDQDLKRYRFDRLNELSMPDQTNYKRKIIWGYILCFLVPIRGITMGWRFAYSTKTLPDGARTFTYSDTTRKEGKRIMWTGIFVVVTVLLLCIYWAVSTD